MKTSLVSTLMLAALSLSTISTRAQQLNTLTLEEKQTGWRLLFDGKTLAGWRAYNKQSPPGAGWKAEDSLLKKVGGQRGGDIITEDQFGDFEFSWEWNISKAGNNGVKYLVSEQRPSAPGHEYQMIDDNGHPDGKLGPKRQTASFYDVLPPATDKPLKPVGEWNHSRIIVQGNKVEHWLNGKNVLTYELGSEATKAALAASKFKNAPDFGTKIRGHIMLTDHQDECLFRNLKIRATEKR